MGNDSISLNEFVLSAPDHRVWRPIKQDEVDHFLSLVKIARESLKADDKHAKGTSLEDLMTFVYKRFDHLAKITPNVNQGDNQIDHIIEFTDGLVPTFIHNDLGLRVIGESKNHNKSIGVREVADLNELLRSKRAKVGIFSSAKTFSRGRNGSPWQYAEGKRRKLALARSVAIIGFTIDEIESLIHNNFYTMIKEKYYNLVDEIEDDYTDHLEGNEKLPYNQRLYSALKQLATNGILTKEEFDNGTERIIEKYGSVDEDYEPPEEKPKKKKAKKPR